MWKSSHDGTNNRNVLAECFQKRFITIFGTCYRVSGSKQKKKQKRKSKKKNKIKERNHIKSDWIR